MAATASRRPAACAVRRRPTPTPPFAATRLGLSRGRARREPIPWPPARVTPWGRLGEIEGIALTLSFLRQEQEETQRLARIAPIDLGMPDSPSRHQGPACRAVRTPAAHAVAEVKRDEPCSLIPKYLTTNGLLP